MVTPPQTRIIVVGYGPGEIISGYGRKDIEAGIGPRDIIIEYHYLSHYTRYVSGNVLLHSRVFGKSTTETLGVSMLITVSILYTYQLGPLMFVLCPLKT